MCILSRHVPCQKNVHTGSKYLFEFSSSTINALAITTYFSMLHDECVVNGKVLHNQFQRERNSMTSNYYGHTIAFRCRDSQDWFRKYLRVSMRPCICSRCCTYNISVRFNLVPWGLTLDAFECVIFVIRALAWTFSDSSTWWIVSVYMDNPWDVFLWFSFSWTSDTRFLRSRISYMWQRLSHETIHWLPGTMMYEWRN